VSDARLVVVVRMVRERRAADADADGRLLESSAPPSPPCHRTCACSRAAQALGRGGYGMVYAAQKTDTGKLYAVKCMGRFPWLCNLAGGDVGVSGYACEPWRPAGWQLHTR
jgi:hypothetical protein